MIFLIKLIETLDRSLNVSFIRRCFEFTEFRIEYFLSCVLMYFRKKKKSFFCAFYLQKYTRALRIQDFASERAHEKMFRKRARSTEKFNLQLIACRITSCVYLRVHTHTHAHAHTRARIDVPRTSGATHVRDLSATFFYNYCNFYMNGGEYANSRVTMCVCVYARVRMYGKILFLWNESLSVLFLRAMRETSSTLRQIENLHCNLRISVLAERRYNFVIKHK